MLGLVAPVHAQIRDWGDAAKGGCVVNGVPTLKCFEVIFSNIVYMASTFIIFALFIMIVLGAFQYLSSFGDPAKVKKAQATLRFAIAGFVLFLSSFVILRVIDTLFLGGAGTIFQLNLGN